MKAIIACVILFIAIAECTPAASTPSDRLKAQQQLKQYGHTLAEVLQSTKESNQYDCLTCELIVGGILTALNAGFDYETIRVMLNSNLICSELFGLEGSSLTACEIATSFIGPTLDAALASWSIEAVARSCIAAGYCTA